AGTSRASSMRWPWPCIGSWPGHWWGAVRRRHRRQSGREGWGLAADKEPGALGLVRRRQLPEAVQAAWWQDLARWVEELRNSYPHLWPDRPPEGTADFYARTRKRPWPECWAYHDGLVEDLVALKVW